LANGLDALMRSDKRPERAFFQTPPLPSVLTCGQGPSKKCQRSSLSVLLCEAVASLGSASLHRIRSYLMNHMAGFVLSDMFIRKSKFPVSEARDDHF
jgi:hypothetical protein